MEDRELLALAAKAAGIEIWTDIDGNRYTGDPERPWNPLGNDGCALRLAAKLNLSIITNWGFDGNPSGSVGTMLGSHEDLRITCTQHGNDVYSAWRRAIVLGAAEIGKSMP